MLQVVLSLRPGGTERLVLELIKRSAPEIEMAVCCLDEAGAWGEALRDQQIDVVALGRQAGFHPLLGRRIADMATRHDVNVIHCHHYSPFVYSCCARLFRPSTNIVFTEHGRLSDATPSPKRRMANRLLSRLPREVYTVSHELKQHLIAEGFAEKHVGVIYNGIDIGAVPLDSDRRRVRSALGLSDDVVLVGTIARLDPVKNLEVAIEAVASLHQRAPVLLAVIGDGDERSRLEEVAQNTPCPAAIRFLGHREDARELLAACDVYVNSSISEGISLTILEAMAARVPVVATRVGGTPEILDDTCGRLVPARNTAALAEALADLIAQPAVRAKLGRAGRERVEARFTIERMVREYRDAYFRAVA